MQLLSWNWGPDTWPEDGSTAGAPEFLEVLENLWSDYEVRELAEGVSTACCGDCSLSHLLLSHEYLLALISTSCRVSHDFHICLDRGYLRNYG